MGKEKGFLINTNFSQSWGVKVLCLTQCEATQQNMLPYLRVFNLTNTDTHMTNNTTQLPLHSTMGQS